ncbi:MAG: CaiB/BaiF CoA transferase family protein [Saccharofermentanales bacterium]
MGKALEGVRVLDLGRYLSGPYSGMLLADMGAEVIKIEKRGGDLDRELHPWKNGKSMYVPMFARNKRCITLNFRSPDGQKLLREFVKRSDVVISNFRAGVLEKMGLDYESVKMINPRIIVAAISGYGQKGANAGRTAFDGAATALSGVMYENFIEGIGPRNLGSPIADITTGYVNTLAVVMALFQRERTGVGQFIDTAMVDCMVPYLESRIPSIYIDGYLWEPGGRKGGDPNSAPANIFKAKDGYIYVHAGSLPHFQILRKITEDYPEFHDVIIEARFDDRETRVEHFEYIEELMGKWVGTMTVDEAEKRISGAGIPASRVNRIEDLLQDNDYVKEREQIVWIDMPGVGKIPFAGSPLKLSDSPVDTFRPGEDVGQSNYDIYSSVLGMRREEIDAYIEKGVI